MMQRDEILIRLTEECAETIQMATKLLRFGADSVNPYEPTKGTNRERLSEEIGHVMAWIAKGFETGLIDKSIASESAIKKAKEITS